MPDQADRDNSKFAQRDKQINVRIDAELYEAATAKAYEYGLGPTIRALLRSYVRGEIHARPEDLKAEITSAPRERRPRRLPKPAK